MMICCPRATTSLPRGQAHRQLITMNLSEFFSFLHKLLQRMNFKHVYLLFWCFLELFIGKFILNINNEREQDYSCPGAREKLPLQGRLPGVVQWVTRLSKLPRGKGQIHVNSYRRQIMHRGKVDPGVSELPRGNELSREHVNRP